MSSTFSVLKWRTWRWAPPALSATDFRRPGKFDVPDEQASVIALPAAEHAGWLLVRLRRMFAHFSRRGFLGTDWSNPLYSNPIITHASEDSLNLDSRRSVP